MKRIFAGILALGSALANAQLLLPTGTRATLTVEYSYAAAGSVPGKYDSKDWKVDRKLTLSAQMVAQAQQPRPSMHMQDAAQRADMSDKQDKARRVARTMTPMANDMMSIVTKCGEDEACIAREVQKYGGNMQMTPELKQAGDDITAIGKEGPVRYQLWKLASITGTYSIDEAYNSQTTEITEGPARKFHRHETRQGGGPVPAAVTQGAVAMFEVDNVKKDIMMSLPSLAGPLTVTRNLVTDVPGEKSGTGSVPSYSIGKLLNRITASVGSGLRELRGSQSVKQQGADGEGGTLTVSWRLVVQ